MGYYPRLRDLREDRDCLSENLRKYFICNGQPIITTKPEKENFIKITAQIKPIFFKTGMQAYYFNITKSLMLHTHVPFLVFVIPTLYYIWSRMVCHNNYK